MAIAVNATKQALAQAYANLATYASLHTANPGTTGASEVSGGSPAYARKAITWTVSAAGVATATVTFDVGAGTTVAGIGLWSAATGGSFRDGSTVTAQAFASQGSYALTLTYTQA